MSKELEQLETWIDENKITLGSGNFEYLMKLLMQKIRQLKSSEVDYQSQEPKQREVSEEINIFEDSTYTIQFRDNETSRGTSDFKIKGKELLKLMLPISVVTEKEYIPSDAFADELSVWKEKDYALKTSSIKEQEAVEFAEWIIKNEYEFFDNTSEGNIYISDEKPNKPFTMKELFNLFKSTTNNNLK
jgi:hypothetical protein